MMEYEQVKFTRKEVIEVISTYVCVKYESIEAVISLLEKLGVVPEYVFKEEKQKK